jgi:hypothetical protein
LLIITPFIGLLMLVRGKIPFAIREARVGLIRLAGGALLLPIPISLMITSVWMHASRDHLKTFNEDARTHLVGVYMANTLLLTMVVCVIVAVILVVVARGRCDPCYSNGE